MDGIFGFPRGYENSKPPNEIGFQPFLFFLQCLEGSGYKAKPYVVTPPETSVAPENSWLEDYF